MANSINKNKKKKEVKLNRYIVLSTLVLVLLIIVSVKQRATINNLMESYQEQSKYQQKLKEEIKYLENEVKNVNNLDYIEKKAREDLGMIKKDEKLYIEDKKTKDAH